MRIVLTRPEADSERTAKVLRARGHDVLVAPLMRVEPVDFDLTSQWGGVIVTSANAPAALANHPARDELCGLPLYAVGRRSADAARQIGFRNVTSAGGDLRDLVQVICEHRADAKAPLLYLAGADRSGDLIGDLAVHGIAAELAVVYRAATAPFPSALIDALQAGTVDAVLHFSRRSAENYVDGAKKAGIVAHALAVKHLCLSANIAEPLVNARASQIAIAKHPDEMSLLALVDVAQG
ncbi:MAG: uroporphyrinogen-III synthase [Rhodopseudomonas sp.]|nr:uroporphyrinogen-III synthase [Rhodopseudomonas sp.]